MAADLLQFNSAINTLINGALGKGMDKERQQGTAETRNGNPNLIISWKATANVFGSLQVKLINRNSERIKRWRKRSKRLKNKLISRRL